MKLYSVYDVTAKTYSEPFAVPSDEVAQRNFRFTMTRYDDFFVKDMELRCVGEFDNITGSIVSIPLYVVDRGLTILAEKESLKETENEKSSI